jgi:hypothetical protein
MIVVVAPYPSAENERDGYLQRINAIEQSLTDFNRIYLEIAFLGNILPSKQRHSGRLTVYKLNFFLHFPYFLYRAFRSDRIYVHTVKNGFKVLPLYFFKPIWTDLHGIGSEEAKMIGRPVRSKVHALSEFMVVKFSQKVVVVTKRMSSFIQEKYSKLKVNFLYIPICNFLGEGKISKVKKEQKPLVIYSGGLHGWQNIEKMAEAAGRLQDRFDFLFLVSDKEGFKAKAKDKCDIEKIGVDSVSRSEIRRYYEKADFGFLLRDDNAVNQVACPTKLIEYIEFGIVPILLQPNVGDFKELGLKYILLSDLFDGLDVSKLDLDEMRRSNLSILDKITSQFNEGIDSLKRELASA